MQATLETSDGLCRCRHEQEAASAAAEEARHAADRQAAEVGVLQDAMAALRQEAADARVCCIPWSHLLCDRHLEPAECYQAESCSVSGLRLPCDGGMCQLQHACLISPAIVQFASDSRWEYC